MTEAEDSFRREQLFVHLRICTFYVAHVANKAVILLVNTQINKYTNEHCQTVPIRWCLLCICFFSVVLLATWATQMRKYTNAQIAVPASLIC